MIPHGHARMEELLQDVNKFPDILRYTVPLITHDNESASIRMYPVKTLPLKKSAVNRHSRIRCYYFLEVAIQNPNLSERAHRGLDSLRIIDVHGIAGGENSGIPNQ